MQNIRIGLGHDTHRLIPGIGIRLGGVNIPHDQKLDGFSDADVLIHAVIDALLGASNLPDIGQIFPDSDERNRNRNSMEMLSEVQFMLKENNWRVINIDAIVFAELPKIAPYKDKMKENISKTLDISSNDISIKGKTGEKIGIIGRQEAVSAEAVVLLEKRDPPSA